MNISPIKIGLDALGVSSPDGVLLQLGIKRQKGRAMVQQVAGCIERAMVDYPEIRSEIVVAGMYILLGQVDDIDEVRATVLPLMDRAVDRALT